VMRDTFPHLSSCPAEPTWADMPPSMAIICPVM
jgi:hypothetical protein